jgi:putative acetyltransferase
MSLRLEEPSDQAAVRTVVRRAFGDHGPVVADLVDALRSRDPDALSLVAQEDGEVVGHVMFSRCLLDAPRRQVTVQTLSPLGVLPEWQHKGIGSSLVRQGLRSMDERGESLVFLEGNPVYYSRFGFLPGGQHDFRKPSLRIPDPGFQVVKLSAYEPWMTGTFVYSSTFWEYDCVGLRDKDA